MKLPYLWMTTVELMCAQKVHCLWMTECLEWIPDKIASISRLSKPQCMCRFLDFTRTFNPVPVVPPKPQWSEPLGCGHPRLTNLIARNITARLMASQHNKHRTLQLYKNIRSDPRALQSGLGKELIIKYLCNKTNLTFHFWECVLHVAILRYMLS